MAAAARLAMNALEEVVSCLARLPPRGGGRLVARLGAFYRGDGRRTARVGDLSIRLDLRSMLERLMYFRCYEHRLIRFAASLLDEGDVALDAGANIGWLSLQFARRVGRRGQVHSFEPVPEHYARLAETFAAARRLGYRCEANALALGEREETATMSVGNDLNPGFNTLINGFSRDGLRKGMIRVPVRPLDSYLDEHGIGEVKLLKVDTEGAEGMVLRGARRALESRRIRHLIVEISPRAEEVRGLERGDTARFLRGLGYSGWLLEDGRPRPLPDRFDYWVAETYWRA